jgi:uncharacterized protein (DUF1778 family)
MRRKSSTAPSPSTRLDFRLRHDEKQLIEQAAEVEGRTVTDYAIDTLLKAAAASVDRATTRQLSVRDTKRFLALFSEPPAPNAALRAAARAWERNDARARSAPRGGARRRG